MSQSALLSALPTDSNKHREKADQNMHITSTEDQGDCPFQQAHLQTCSSSEDAWTG